MQRGLWRHNAQESTTQTGRMRRREFIGAGAALLLGGVAASAASLASGTRTGSACRLKTVDGDTVAVDGAALRELRHTFKGELLVAGLPGYATARRIWNAAIDRQPAMILRCVDVRDVAGAVRFAERCNALVSVRAGGHNAAGFAICDGGLVIDLTRLNSVTVDRDRRIARADGGATWGDFDATTGKFGLASTGPIVSMVGIGGYTLGGGIGWLHRKVGLACDSLVSAQVVTADGRIVEASRTHDEDLFWALRGGGGNFGIVSAFEFRLEPVSSVLAGLIFHRLEDLPDVAAFVRDFNLTAPDDVCVWLMMRKAPASRALPTEVRGRPVAIMAVCYAGSSTDGEQTVRRLRRFGRPLVDRVTVRSYAGWQKSLDSSWGNGFGNHWAGHYLPDLTDASARTILEHVSRVTSPFTDVKVSTLGGAVARRGEHETAFSYRQSAYALAIQTRWANPRESAEHLAWSRAFVEAMAVHSTGKVYVNFMADEGETRIGDVYNPQTLERLRAIKAAYDPHNRFRMNQNIRPA